MIETKVYLIKSDVKTECHCGHSICVGEQYYMLRTNVPKWISICNDCVALISSPSEINMQDLVTAFFETRPPDGRGKERKESAMKKRVDVRRIQKMKEEERNAEWI